MPMPAGTYLAPELERAPVQPHCRPVGTSAITAVAVALVGAVAGADTKKAPRYMCPPDCGSPPTGTPVMALPRFTAPDGSFSVSYPSPGLGLQGHHNDDPGSPRRTPAGTAASCSCSPSRPAAGRRAGDRPGSAQANLPRRQDRLRDPQRDGRLPARLRGGGRHWPQGTSATATSGSGSVVMTAVKNDLALVAVRGRALSRVRARLRPRTAVGGQPRSSPRTWASTSTASRWKGDPPR